MKDIKTEYRNEFLKRFAQSEIFKEEQAAFNNIFGKTRWWLFSSADKRTAARQLKDIGATKGRALLTKRCKKILHANINKARRTKKVALFKNNNFYCICLPLGRGDNIYGYLILSGLERKPDGNLLSLLSSFTNSII